MRAAIARKAFERREIANAQTPEGSAVPRDTFSDPMILDTLGLHDTYLEKDLEARDPARPRCLPDGGRSRLHLCR